MRPRSGASGWRRPAQPMLSWVRRPWSSMTSPRCTSRVRHEAHGSYPSRSGGQREGRLVGRMANRVRETGPGTIAGQEPWAGSELSGTAPREDPRDMAKTELFEPQCPEDVNDTYAGRRRVQTVA